MLRCVGHDLDRLKGLSPEAVIDALGLTPHPSCGYAAVTHRVFGREFRGVERARDGTHALASALYFLVTADSPPRLHRIPASHMYHHYCGSPLDVLLLYPDGAGETAAIGSIADGLRPQL
jgi:uncharacterized protein